MSLLYKDLIATTVRCSWQRLVMILTTLNAQPSTYALVKSQSTLNAQGCQTWVITHYPDERFLLGEMGSVNTKMRLCFKLLHFFPHFHKTHCTSWDICSKDAEWVWRKMRAKINTHNNSNDPHLYISLLFIKCLPNLNSTGAALGKEVRKISLRILSHFMHFQNYWFKTN